MKVHYFQRYHSKENVATANTMLLLSRLYAYSPSKFFQLLQSEYFTDSFIPEITFDLQKRSGNSVPDAIIAQDSFKIVVETKLTDWFHNDQLWNHLSAFGNEKQKILLTIASEPMNLNTKKELEEKIKEYNQKLEFPIHHVNTTFQDLINHISDVLDDRDYELNDILNDYIDYCCNDKLIPNTDSWKYLRMQLSNTTFEFNKEYNVYYDKADRGFRAHDYIGLYRQKMIQAIGKICTQIVAYEDESGIHYEVEKGELKEEYKEIIQKAMIESKSFGYDLKSIRHRYFFVDQFYDTHFRKVSKGGAMGTKFFDLSELLGIDSPIETNKIAEELSKQVWN